MVGKAARPGDDELAAQVAELREQVRTRKAENARLRAELAGLRGEDGAGGARPAAGTDTASSPPTRKTPPRWARANVVRVASRRPRRPRAPVSGRRRDVPDRRVVHARSHCPHCQAALHRGRVGGRRQVLTLPPVRAAVVEPVVLERRCRCCGTVGRGLMPDLSAEVGPGRRVGWDVAALVAVLRTKLRMPIGPSPTCNGCWRRSGGDGSRWAN